MKDFKKIIPYLIVLIISCNKKSEIHINISTTTEINKEMNTIDSTYLLNSDYFEIELQSYKNGEYFKAEKDQLQEQLKQSIDKNFKICHQYKKKIQEINQLVLKLEKYITSQNNNLSQFIDESTINDSL